MESMRAPDAAPARKDTHEEPALPAPCAPADLIAVRPLGELLGARQLHATRMCF